MLEIKKKILDISKTILLRNKNCNKKIVFCTGCYDILQSGHAVFFNQCKAFGDILVVGVGRDSTIRALKGPSRPVNPQNNRVYLVAAMQDVDYAILNDEEVVDGKIDFLGLLDALKPDVFVLNDDDGAIDAKRAICEARGIRLELVGREVPPELEATSTTRIIDKINFAWKAPLRIDFAGGWSDVPYIMGGKTGYVSNIAIRPLVELGNGKFNFSGYPRGSGLSTSTAAKVLELISAKGYNVDALSLETIAEDLFTLENSELNWAIGRQDQYAIVYGGYHCFAFGDDGAQVLPGKVDADNLARLRSQLLLIHTGVSRNAQLAVEEVYRNYQTDIGRAALETITRCGRRFHEALCAGDLVSCAATMEENFMAQKLLAPATSTPTLDALYACAKANGALGGKLCGAGGGGAFIFLSPNPHALKHALKKQFVDSFEIDFEFEMKSIKELNVL